ncbi:4084_t:CDS:2 [Entrophospora sp. SA101]|nr:4084_t:CDS:2 [Entrophospora sp. SA101]CAJ0898421.1 13477_t:CDS:2 [Entrophospora sp. SA101]
MIKPPYKHSLHLYRHTLRYIRSSSLPFPYLRSKLHYNTRELFEIYRDEQDENKVNMLINWGWRDLEFLKAWKFVEKDSILGIKKFYCFLLNEPSVNNEITEKMVDKGKRKLYETSTGTSSATNKIKISDWSSFITSENYQNTLSRVDSETFIEVVTKRIKNIENKDDLLNDILDFVPENGFIVAKLK